MERKRGQPILPSHRSYFLASRVVLVAAGEIVIEDSAQTPRRFTAGLDSVMIWPAGHESAELSGSSGTCELIDLELDPGTLARLAPEERISESQLTPRHGIRDQQLTALIRAMAWEVEAGCPTGSRYGEALSLALAAYLRHYSTGAGTAQPPRGGLSREQLPRVLDYIRSNLGQDLSLAGLAAVARLSPRHFARAFRTTLGVSPHQYVLSERIREARRLLELPSSIVQVALQLGFANQSHFTESFHRATGVTPRRYQEVR
jgi:AraC family transcriptional regulator